MAVIAPTVEYYRLVDDGTGAGKYKFDTGTPATLLDFGTIDAGTSTYEATQSNITNTLKGCQVYAIFNSKGASNDASDMQNTTLSVVSNETGHEGNKVDTVYDKSWVNVLMNNESFGSDAVALGNVTGSEITKVLTAVGEDSSTNPGLIKGTKNDGTLTNATSNYVICKLWVNIEPNAPAGPHKFRLRITYSYT